MFGSVWRRVARTLIQVACAISVLLAVQAQAQAQSIAGTWTTQGRDWVWFFQENGRAVIVGTGVKPVCSGVSSRSGPYTASAGSLILVSDAKYGCNGEAFPQNPGTMAVNYVLSGNTLTLNNLPAGDLGISTATLTLLPAQTASVVGTIWNTQGRDWVTNYQAEGHYVVTGTHLGPPGAPSCATPGSWHGTYSVSAGTMSFSLDTWTCGGTSISGAGFSGQGKYALTGNTLTYFVDITSGQNTGDTYGLMMLRQGGTTTTPSVDPTTPLPQPQVTQTVFTVPTGELPAAAVSVIPSGNFGNATLVVRLDLSKVLAGGSFAAQGQFAAGYNIYVAALVPGGVLGLPSATWFVYPSTHAWAALVSPIAAYMEGIAQDATNSVEINLLQAMDVTTLVGTEIYIGYGESDQEMLARGRYRGVYRLQ